MVPTDISAPGLDRPRSRARLFGTYGEAGDSAFVTEQYQHCASTAREVKADHADPE
jgi:hypothetical protein